MPEITLAFDRQETYALLAATECLRQHFSEEGGIPLISSIRPVSTNREYTEMEFVFELASLGDFVLNILVEAGDLWPKKGSACATFVETDGMTQYQFVLEGNPGQPKVRFTHSWGDDYFLTHKLVRKP